MNSFEQISTKTPRTLRKQIAKGKYLIELTLTKKMVEKY